MFKKDNSQNKKYSKIPTNAPQSTQNIHSTNSIQKLQVHNPQASTSYMAETIEQLQHTLGNQATIQLLRASTSQTISQHIQKQTVQRKIEQTAAQLRQKKGKEESTDIYEDILTQLEEYHRVLEEKKSDEDPTLLPILNEIVRLCNLHKTQHSESGINDYLNDILFAAELDIPFIEMKQIITPPINNNNNNNNNNSSSSTITGTDEKVNGLYRDAQSTEIIGQFIQEKFDWITSNGGIFILDDIEYAKQKAKSMWLDKTQKPPETLWIDIYGKLDESGAEDHAYRDGDNIYIRKGYEKHGTKIHEIMHRYSDHEFNSTFGFLLNEAATDYYSLKIDSTITSDLTYGSLVDVLKDMMQTYGITETEMASAYFKGDIDPIREKIEAKKPGFFDKLCQASKAQDSNILFYALGVEPEKKAQ